MVTVELYEGLGGKKRCRGSEWNVCGRWKDGVEMGHEWKEEGFKADKSCMKSFILRMNGLSEGMRRQVESPERHARGKRQRGKAGKKRQERYSSQETRNSKETRRK